jgi:hypothetical protein
MIGADGRFSGKYCERLFIKKLIHLDSLKLQFAWDPGWDRKGSLILESENSRIIATKLPKN